MVEQRIRNPSTGVRFSIKAPRVQRVYAIGPLGRLWKHGMAVGQADRHLRIYQAMERDCGTLPLALDTFYSVHHIVTDMIGTFKHYQYNHNHAVCRCQRQGVNGDLVVTFVFSKENDESWQPMYDWLAEQNIRHFTFTAFSDDWRRNFSFYETRDAMLFKLTFSHMVN